jgi:hypothetical protein
MEKHHDNHRKAHQRCTVSAEVVPVHKKDPPRPSLFREGETGYGLGM